MKARRWTSWDGYFGFFTNAKELGTGEVLGAYRELWQIEESFRCMKSTLKIRPIYHWTARRIEGHVMMSFLSFYVLRAMEKLLEGSGIQLSPERLMEELSEIRAVEIKTKEKTYHARTKIEGLRHRILRALGVKIPPFILKEIPVVE